MISSAWRLNRRRLLRGLGFGVALPWLEAMGPLTSASAASQSATARPRRFCGIFFANGVALPGKGKPGHDDWHWFPHTDGADYEFTKPLEPLAARRADMTILGNLSHANSRTIVGHNTADVWLTGADIRENVSNSISLDQVIARHIGHQTRVPSLVMSSSGGVGGKSRATTISFDGQGLAIPAESTPRRIFERLFTQSGEGDRASRQRSLASGKRRVDFLMDDARSLRNRLGQPDQRRLDEFLQSLSEVESRLVRAESWLDKALPQVDPNSVNLDVSPKGPVEFIRTMFDLIVLAFETDTTRVATYQISAEDGVGICDRFPAIVGFGDNHHKLSHGDMLKWSQYDRFLSEQFAYFLERLANVREPAERLLDNVVCLYGSATSTTHAAWAQA